jgi:hypothetical protein
MRHNLSITSLIRVDRARGLELRGPVTVVAADTDLGPFPQFHPESFDGKLVDVSDDQLYSLKFGQGVVAALEGVGYIFEKLERDGSFTLCKRVAVAA